MKRVTVLLILLYLVACAPAPSQDPLEPWVAQTLAAMLPTDTPTPGDTLVPTSTATHIPTDTPTPTDTPLPYMLSVVIVDAEGAPIPGAELTFDALGEGEGLFQVTDEEGMGLWQDLPNEAVSLQVRAPGYFPAEIEGSIQRGENEITVVLERDPYGLLPVDLLEEGESLVYLEDFQDGEEGFIDLVGSWQIVESDSEPGNLVLQVDQTGSQDTAYANFDPTGEEVNDFTIGYKFRFIDLGKGRSNWVSLSIRDHYWISSSVYWSNFQILDTTLDEWKFPFQLSKSYRDGVWYTVKAEVEGNQVTLNIDGKMVGRVGNIPDHPAKWAFSVGRDVNFIEFDDIFVKTPGD